jgi:toluene monooxygenase system ferredoxin subunit
MGASVAIKGAAPYLGVALVEGDLDGATLTCRGHHWQFNALNGEGINPRRTHLKCFFTEVVAGKVLIGVPNDNAGNRGSTRGPSDSA